MKSEDNVLGKGIEAIFARTAHLKKGGEKSLELPNGEIHREGDQLVIRLVLDKEDDIRGAIEELAEASKNGMLDQLVDTEKLKNNWKEHIELAQMAFAEKDFTAAAEEYLAAIRISDIPEIRFNLAVTYERLKQVENAAKQYRLVLKTTPNDVPSLNNLGRLIYNRGDFSKAMDYYQKAVQYKPNLSAGGKSSDLFAPRFPCRKIKL